jgi:hypothetical protein
MEEVKTSSSGIIKNILSLNYTDEDVVKEYLNNVLPKNENNSEYEIEMSFKTSKDFGCFDFIEKGSGNPRGFESIPALEKAYRIADSDRSETNNMGYGIYSPICISKNSMSVNFFIQDTPNGSFYSISLYNGDPNEPLIYTEQGLLSGLTYDIERVKEEKGTRSIWFIFRPLDRLQHPSVDILIPVIMEKFDLSVNATVEPSKSIPKSIGKYYFDYLNAESKYPIKITYNGETVSGIDILEPVGSSAKRSITFDLLAGPDEFYIKKDNESPGEYTQMLKKYTGRLHGAKEKSKKHYGCQSAKLTICDVNFKTKEDEKKTGQKDTDKKIWVKVGKTYIFQIDFPGWIATNSIRAVIHFDRVENNNFDNFITPNANKSNSTLIRDLVDRISGLVKFTDRTDFTMEVPRKEKVQETKDEKRIRVWQNIAGDKLYSDCKSCGTRINVVTCKIVKKKSSDSAFGGGGVPYETIYCAECSKS